jgi:hypothetical protein
MPSLDGVNGIVTSNDSPQNQGNSRVLFQISMNVGEKFRLVVNIESIPRIILTSGDCDTVNYASSTADNFASLGFTLDSDTHFGTFSNITDSFITVRNITNTALDALCGEIGEYDYDVVETTTNTSHTVEGNPRNSFDIPLYNYDTSSTQRFLNDGADVGVTVSANADSQYQQPCATIFGNEFFCQSHLGACVHCSPPESYSYSPPPNIAQPSPPFTSIDQTIQLLSALKNGQPVSVACMTISLVNNAKFYLYNSSGTPISLASRLVQFAPAALP